jgi:hypothetical protein
MRSSPYQRIQVGLLNLEVHIQPVQHLQGNIWQQVVNHLYVEIALYWIFSCVRAYLDPSWVKGRVLVLEWGDKDYVLEPVETFWLGKLKENCLLQVFVLWHA